MAKEWYQLKEQESWSIQSEDNLKEQITLKVKILYTKCYDSYWQCM